MPSDSVTSSAAFAPEQLDWVAVDWGTSRLRAWAIDQSGRVCDEASSCAGMGSLTPGEFEPALRGLLSCWKVVDRPIDVLACGMLGARGGWQEIGYRAVPCRPVDTAQLHRVSIADRQLSVRIVPGLSQHNPPDVMRGEETQLAGLVSAGVDDAVVCLPGSHSKWVRVTSGRVAAFRTALTGETFAALSNHTVLRQTLCGADARVDPEFDAAVREALRQPGRFLGMLFSLRSATLLEGVAPSAARERLSGWLIGLELAGSEPFWRDAGCVQLIGEESLSRRYRRALDVLGIATTLHNASALAVAGLASVRATAEN